MEFDKVFPLSTINIDKSHENQSTLTYFFYKDTSVPTNMKGHCFHEELKYNLTRWVFIAIQHYLIIKPYLRIEHYLLTKCCF